MGLPLPNPRMPFIPGFTTFSHMEIEPEGSISRKRPKGAAGYPGFFP